jgi:Cytochrome C and Quinol oxidase polypeptide I
MGRYLVPAAMVAAMLAFAVSALAAGLTPYQPGWWRGAVSLAVLGGITPMIYAVNLRIVPVFARRTWPSAVWPRVQMGLAIAGAWMVFAGSIVGNAGVVIAGSALALGGGIVFLANILALFRQPATLPGPPLPYPGQVDVDRIATHFMRLAGAYLVFGLGVGLVTSVWQPETGRWELVWAHAMLVGFFLSMASGVCYHVLSRWTGRSWGAIALIRLHLATVGVGLPVMLLALATDRAEVFAIAGPLLAMAIGLFLVNIAPMVPALPNLTRPAFAAAMVLLVTGVTFGALFAIDPATGARLRLVHAEINLFGWAGLLISGAGYYLVPRFAGQPLRWPLLATLQLSTLMTGVVLGAAALAWRAYGSGPAPLVLAGQACVCAGFLLFGAQIAGTFRRNSPGTVASLPLVSRQPTTPGALRLQ